MNISGDKIKNIKDQIKKLYYNKAPKYKIWSCKWKDMENRSRRVETHTVRAIQEVKRKPKRSLKREQKKDYAFQIKMC